MKIHNYWFVTKPLPLLWVFCLIFFASCTSSRGWKSSSYDGNHEWVMNVLLNQGYKLEVLEGNELNIIPVGDQTAASSGYTILFKPSDGFRLEAMKARLLSMGALEVKVVKRQ